MSRGVARGSNTRQRVIYGRENVNYAGPDKATDITVSTDPMADWSDESAGTVQAIASAGKKRGNVSAGTNLCELGICDDSDPVEVADALAELPEENLPRVLRAMSAEEICETIETWRSDAIDVLEDLFSPEKVIRISQANEGGNFAASDLTATLSDGRTIPVECKFGSATDAASGIKTITDVLGEESFTLTKQQRDDLLIKHDPNDVPATMAAIHTLMTDYVATFEGTSVDSEKVFDLIRSSGKAGNSATTQGYTILNFGDPNASDSSVKSKALGLSPEDQWDATVSVTKGDSGSVRLKYVLTSGDKTIRMTYNNKNTSYAVPAEGGGWRAASKNAAKGIPGAIRLESSTQLGGSSYNVWYSDGKN